MSGSGESNVNKALRRTRRDSRDEPVQTVGYQTETGDEAALTGDEHAPYAYALARATTDGSAVNTADKGEPQFLLCDEEGRLYTRDSAIATPASRYSSAALEQQAVVKSSSGLIWELRMLVTTGIAADRWLMVFNAAAAVANNAVPIWRSLLPNPGSARAEVWDGFERPFEASTGIVVAISTTEVALTLPGANEALFQILYA